MPNFIKGLELCEAFFHECGYPIIRRNYPELKFTAGLLGYGSDVLGYDDVVSTDHMWGPRFYLFLKNEDISVKEQLMELFSNELPCTFRGYSVHFSKPNPNDNGVRHAECIDSGPVSPLIWIYTVDEFVDEYLGGIPKDDLAWLALSEHRLLGFTGGKLFVDSLGMQKIRNALSFYPDQVKLYLIASQWVLIAQEQAFVKRASDCGDELGSRIICSRIAERLMRLCFLYQNKYAPYSKWFGTGFEKLSGIQEISREIYAAVSANTILERETHMVKAQVLVTELHNESHLTKPLEVSVQKYFSREIDVIYAERIAEKVRETISHPVLRMSPLIGSMSQVGDFTELSDEPKFQGRIRGLYKSEGN